MLPISRRSAGRGRPPRSGEAGGWRASPVASPLREERAGRRPRPGGDRALEIPPDLPLPAGIEPSSLSALLKGSPALLRLCNRLATVLRQRGRSVLVSVRRVGRRARDTEGDSMKRAIAPALLALLVIAPGCSSGNKTGVAQTSETS